MDVLIVGAQQRIDSLQTKAGSRPISDDPELQAQIARLLCVLTSGLIEQAVVAILEEYSRSKSHPRVARYASNQLGKLRNAKFKDILVILAVFDPLWSTHFEETTSDEIRDAVDSIVANRNQIAHGRQANLSLSTFNQYYRAVKSFISSLESFVQRA